MILKSYDSFLNESFSINDFNIGDKVIVNGEQSSLQINNQPGIIGKKSYNRFYIEFENKFSTRLHSNSNNYYPRSCWNITFSNNKITIKKNSDNKYINKLTYEFLHSITNKEVLDSRMVYIKYTDKPDMISYLSLNKAQRLKDDRKWRSYYTTNQRQEVKIGKFLKKVFPDSTESQIEKMVNDYKFSYKHHFKFFDFEIVKGEDIRKYYLYTNYDDNGGRLHSSCMKQENDQHRFDIYVENPDVCSMLILKSPTNDKKITGRALIWKLTNGNTYMDRIYCANDDEMQLFKNYAKERDWKIFDVHGYTSSYHVQLQNDKNYGRDRNNPYMDTFKCYIKEDNILYSDYYRGNYDHFYDDH